MLFNSYEFIFMFLPLCLAGYFLLNRLGMPKLSHLWLFGMSLWFYGSNTPKYLLLISASIVINYGFYMLSRYISGDKKKKTAMAVAVAVNLGILFYYKYFNFFIDTLNALLPTEWTVKTILLPLGISFFTFQQVSFVVDAFRGEVPADYDFLDYACFVTFFPQLVAGPIVTHDELVPQLMDESRRKFDFENFARGIFIFSMGLAKKVLLADNLSYTVNSGFGWVSASAFDVFNSSAALITMLAYTLQMYFDFSGYSDMAIGIGKMFNIDLPQNFNSPYKALTIVDHWKRWHLTLTRFLTKYVYIPLGGSRRGSRRTYINIVLVYFLSGIWHGAGWTYILWGLLHGIFNALTRWADGFFRRIPKAVNWLITFSFINLGFIVFRAPSLELAFDFISRIFDFDFGPVSYTLIEYMSLPEVRMLMSSLPFIGHYLDNVYVMAGLFMVFCMFTVLVPANAYEKMKKMKPGLMTLLPTLFIFFWCIMSFGRVSEFLYFNF